MCYRQRHACTHTQPATLARWREQRAPLSHCRLSRALRCRQPQLPACVCVRRRFIAAAADERACVLARVCVRVWRVCVLSAARDPIRRPRPHSRLIRVPLLEPVGTSSCAPSCAELRLACTHTLESVRVHSSYVRLRTHTRIHQHRRRRRRRRFVYRHHSPSRRPSHTSAAPPPSPPPCVCVCVCEFTSPCEHVCGVCCVYPCMRVCAMFCERKSRSCWSLSNSIGFININMQILYGTISRLCNDDVRVS